MKCFGLTKSLTARRSLTSRWYKKKSHIDWREFVSARFEPVSKQYDLKTTAGEGAYGKVFIGRDKRCPDGRLVAIKRMKKSHKMSITYRTEIDVMKDLDHPNICRLLETFEDESHFFFVMEYCEGGELFEVIVRNHFITERISANITHQLASALRYCHGRSILHRDLKPENVCFCDKAFTPTSQIKVIDWGLAMFEETRRTAAGGPVVANAGSVPYAAPEVLLNRPYTRASDLWSLAVITYVMVSGEPPFYGPLQQMVGQICTATYSLQGRWEQKKLAADFVSKLLVFDPEKRMTIEEVFLHPWLVDAMKEDSALDPRKSAGILNNLYKFQELSCFRTLCSMAIARHMDHKKLVDIHRIFRDLDTNSDGVLTVEEVKRGFGRLFGEAGGSDAEIEEMFNAVDVSGGGVLDYTEFCAAALNPSTEFQDDVLWTTYRSFDKNGNGQLQASDLASILEKQVDNLGGRERLCKGLANRIVQKYDANHEGQVSFDEFKKFVRGYVAASSFEDFDDIGSQCFSAASLGERSFDVFDDGEPSSVADVDQYLRKTSGLVFLTSGYEGRSHIGEAGTRGLSISTLRRKERNTDDAGLKNSTCHAGAFMINSRKLGGQSLSTLESTSNCSS